MKHRRAYRTRPELAVEMLKLLCNHRKNQCFHAVADSAYGGQSVLCCLPTNCDLTSRLLKDARLYGPRPGAKAGRRVGRANGASVCPRRKPCSRVAVVV